MSKILPAECLAGIVKCENKVIAEAEVLSQGTNQSSGLLIIENNETTYLTTQTKDLEDLITLLDQILQNTIAILTTLDGLSTSPGTAAAAIVALTTLEAQLPILKENLR